MPQAGNRIGRNGRLRSVFCAPAAPPLRAVGSRRPMRSARKTKTALTIYPMPDQARILFEKRLINLCSQWFANARFILSQPLTIRKRFSQLFGRPRSLLGLKCFGVNALPSKTPFSIRTQFPDARWRRGAGLNPLLGPKHLPYL